MKNLSKALGTKVITILSLSLTLQAQTRQPSSVEDVDSFLAHQRKQRNLASDMSGHEISNCKQKYKSWFKPNHPEQKSFIQCESQAKKKLNSYVTFQKKEACEKHRIDCN